MWCRRPPCATCAPLSTTDEDAAWAALSAARERADALGMGCGLGQGALTGALLERMLNALHGSGLPCVIDADALNLLARRPACLTSPALRVLTPHPGEAARLLGVPAREIGADAAGRIAHRYGAAVVLKGAASVLHAGGEEAISPFGSPAMAKGGSGDALTGVIAALLAGRAAGLYGMGDLALLQAACALHGLAGERAGECFGLRGALATDLCAFLGMDDAWEEAREDSPLGRNVHDGGARPRHARRAGARVRTALGLCGRVPRSGKPLRDARLLGVSGPPEWFEGEVAARGLSCAGRWRWSR